MRQLVNKAIVWREYKECLRRRAGGHHINGMILFIVCIPLFFGCGIFNGSIFQDTNALYLYLTSTTFVGAYLFTTFKLDWFENMFDYILIATTSPRAHAISCAISMALLISALVIPTGSILAFCCYHFFNISITFIDIVLIVCIPLILGFTAALSRSIRLIFFTKGQWVYSIISMIIMVIVLILAVLGMGESFIINWILVFCILIIVYGAIDILAMALLDKERMLI